MKRLTGKYTITKNWFGFTIRVEHYVSVSDFVGDDSPDIKIWSKANFQDLSNLNLIK